MCFSLPSLFGVVGCKFSRFVWFVTIFVWPLLGNQHQHQTSPKYFQINLELLGILLKFCSICINCYFTFILHMKTYGSISFIFFWQKKLSLQHLIIFVLNRYEFLSLCFNVFRSYYAIIVNLCSNFQVSCLVSKVFKESGRPNSVNKLFLTNYDVLRQGWK